MEASNRQIEMQLDDVSGYTYVYETKGVTAKTTSKLRQKIWQVFPSVCGSMICVPFGIMVGWPSPTYPTLLKSDSPVFITIDQSAMIAGFLMIGITLATPFSQFRRFGAKYGVILGICLMLLGWILMWQAQDIYWLLGSRILIGLGHGYGMGQLKLYISEICQESLATSLIKVINLFVFFGMILAFAIGPFVNFRQFSIISLIITIFVLFLTIFLPSTPRELLKNGKVTDAQKLIVFLSPQFDTGEEMTKIKNSIHVGDRSFTLWNVMKKPSLRKNFVIFVFLVFFQQFSGIPATLTYSQIIFTESHCSRPELCALLYVIVYFLANAYSIFCIPNYNKKYIFLFSSIGVSVLLIAQIIIIVESVNENFWNFTVLVILLLYNIIHTIGLGSIPFQMINSLFPKEATKAVIQFFVMFHSMLALIITKIFQVMYDRIGLYSPFCLFLVISTFSIIFVIIFVPNKKNKLDSI